MTLSLYSLLFTVYLSLGRARPPWRREKERRGPEPNKGCIRRRGRTGTFTLPVLLGLGTWTSDTKDFIIPVVVVLTSSIIIVISPASSVWCLSSCLRAYFFGITHTHTHTHVQTTLTTLTRDLSNIVVIRRSLIIHQIPRTKKSKSNPRPI